MAKRKEVINGLHNVFTLNVDNLYDISTFSYEQSIDENTILFAIADLQDVGKYITINGEPKIISENDNFIITDGIVFSGNGGGSGSGTSSGNYMNCDASNYIASLDLVSHSITPTWNIKKQDGTKVETKNDLVIDVENGAKVDFSGTWSYANADGITTKPLTSCSGSWGSEIKGANVTYSLTKTDIEVNTTYEQSISAPKSGLEVKNGKVVKATGNDTSKKSTSVTFKHLMYFGSSNKTNLSNLADLQSLSGSEFIVNLSGNKEVKNIVCSNNYAYIAWPKSLGTKIWSVGGLDNKPIESTVTITNQYGKNIEYLITRSENTLNATIDVILK